MVRRKIDPVPPVEVSSQAVHALLARWYPGRAIAIERMGAGVSTPVYRVTLDGDVSYLRLGEEPGERRDAEVRVHELARERGIAVPEILRWEPEPPELDRSAALTARMPGIPLTDYAGDATEALHQAGRDIARINAIPVTGYGWVDTVTGDDRHLVAEHPTRAAWAAEYLTAAETVIAAHATVQSKRVGLGSLLGPPELRTTRIPARSALIVIPSGRFPSPGRGGVRGGEPATRGISRRSGMVGLTAAALGRAQPPCKSPCASGPNCQIRERAISPTAISIPATSTSIPNQGAYQGLIDFGEIRGADPLYDLGHLLVHASRDTFDTVAAGYAEITPVDLAAVRLQAIAIATRALAIQLTRPESPYRTLLTQLPDRAPPRGLKRKT